ncbi:MAG: MarR family transcriptional regulator [Aigarchaeota archaeon]|nr:MarR family transcriptional regulator [Candidatus Pelearchaeum maunauluense]
MDSGRLLGWILVILSAFLAVLTVAAWNLAWQHRDMMMRMMPGVPVQWWIGPTIVLTITIMTTTLALYLTVFRERQPRHYAIGLTAEEQQIVNFLEQQGGKALQKEIARELNLSRLKTHRLVSSLRRRGVVEVERWGNTNLVKLVSRTEQ